MYYWLKILFVTLTSFLKYLCYSLHRKENEGRKGKEVKSLYMSQSNHGRQEILTIHVSGGLYDILLHILCNDVCVCKPRRWFMVISWCQFLKI